MTRAVFFGRSGEEEGSCIRLAGAKLGGQTRPMLSNFANGPELRRRPLVSLLPRLRRFRRAAAAAR